jgi:RimJ/RimL family protein N-acetyltransferase
MDIEAVTISELTPAHLELVAAWLSDPANSQWLNSEWRRQEVSPRLVAMAMRNPRNRMFLVHCGRADCGLIGLYDIDETDRTASVWYVLGEKRFSNRGIMTQALSQLVAHSFSFLRLASLSAWTMEENVSSQKVLQKAGFAPAGRFRKSARFNGRLVDRILFDRILADVE